MRILKTMIERATGKEIQMTTTPQKATEMLTAGKMLPASTAPEAGTSTEPALQGSGLIYDYYESHHEYEITSFGAQGKDSLGRLIN